MLITASLEEQLHAHERALCPLDGKVDRLHQAAIESEREKVTKAAKDIDLAAEQGRAGARGMCAPESDIGLPSAITELVRRPMQERAISDMLRKANHERGNVSGLKEVMGNLEREREKLREAIAASGTLLKGTW
jgi:hypothetical protein